MLALAQRTARWRPIKTRYLATGSAALKTRILKFTQTNTHSCAILYMLAGLMFEKKAAKLYKEYRAKKKDVENEAPRTSSQKIVWVLWRRIPKRASVGLYVCVKSHTWRSSEKKCRYVLTARKPLRYPCVCLTPRILHSHMQGAGI